jgi:hypothetical protein
MEEFARRGKKGHELQKLNNCQMFLEVTNLSEITSVDGKTIKEKAWKGVKDTNKCNQFQWPRSPDLLTPRHWQLWRKTIKECFLDPMKVNERGLLMTLGDWEKNMISTWKWFHLKGKMNSTNERASYGTNVLLCKDNDAGELKTNCTNAFLLYSVKSTPICSP